MVHCCHLSIAGRNRAARSIELSVLLPRRIPGASCRPPATRNWWVRQRRVGARGQGKVGKLGRCASWQPPWAVTGTSGTMARPWGLDLSRIGGARLPSELGRLPRCAPLPFVAGLGRATGCVVPSAGQGLVDRRWKRYRRVVCQQCLPFLDPLWPGLRYRRPGECRSHALAPAGRWLAGPRGRWHLALGPFALLELAGGVWWRDGVRLSASCWRRRARWSIIWSPPDMRVRSIWVRWPCSSWAMFSSSAMAALPHRAARSAWAESLTSEPAGAASPSGGSVATAERCHGGASCGSDRTARCRGCTAAPVGGSAWSTHQVLIAVPPSRRSVSHARHSASRRSTASGWSHHDGHHSKVRLISRSRFGHSHWATQVALRVKARRHFGRLLGSLIVHLPALVPRCWSCSVSFGGCRVRSFVRGRCRGQRRPDGRAIGTVEHALGADQHRVDARGHEHGPAPGERGQGRHVEDRLPLRRIRPALALRPPL